MALKKAEKLELYQVRMISYHCIARVTPACPRRLRRTHKSEIAD
ncbi:MAG: hypothetical protein RMY28_014115 [Nostoc sp. ChiSLP01]